MEASDPLKISAKKLASRSRPHMDVEANFIHTNLLKIALFLGGFGAALQQDS